MISHSLPFSPPLKFLSPCQPQSEDGGLILDASMTSQGSGTINVATRYWQNNKQLGETVTSSVLVASGVAHTPGSATDITSISLTAGT